MPTSKAPAQAEGADDDLPGMLALAKGVAEQQWPHTIDAKAWADQWIEITRDKARVDFADHGWMIGWFANAIMAGYDTAQQRDAAEIASLRERLAEAERLLNTPETLDFLDGVKREAAHQVQRWGYAHDRSKSAENWYWLVGYLAGKALRSAITGDREKARHHTISSAAALANWHMAIAGDTTGAGVGQDDDLRATNPIDAQVADAALAAAKKKEQT